LICISEYINYISNKIVYNHIKIEHIYKIAPKYYDDIIFTRQTLIQTNKLSIKIQSKDHKELCLVSNILKNFNTKYLKCYNEFINNDNHKLIFTDNFINNVETIYVKLCSIVPKYFIDVIKSCDVNFVLHYNYYKFKEEYYDKFENILDNEILNNLIYNNISKIKITIHDKTTFENKLLELSKNKKIWINTKSPYKDRITKKFVTLYGLVKPKNIIDNYILLDISKKKKL